MSNYNISDNKSTIDTIHTINIERTVLCSFLFDYKQFDRMNSKLTKESFYADGHKKIFESMLRLYKQNKPIDEEFIKKDLNSNEYDHILIDILSSNPITNLSQYIETLQENHRQREVDTALSKAHQQKVKENLNSIAFGKVLEKELSKIQNLYQEKKEHKESNSSQIDFTKLSPFLSNLVKDLMQINDYPSSMVLSTVLSSMAGLIGARAKITNGKNITVFPVIWSIIIAPSSLAAKSTLYQYTKKCIFGNIQNELYEEYERKLEQYKIDIKNFKELTKEDRRNEIEPDRPEPKLLVFQNDGTPEAKIKSLQDNQNGGIIYYDEMRAELEKTNNDKSYKALKTSAFEGELLHKRLVNGGSIILKRPVLCEVGLITEQWLLEVANKNDIASGFMARYLFSYNTRDDFKPLQIKDFNINTYQYSEVGQFVIDILGIDREEPILFKLNDEAQKYYIKWFNEYSISAYETETDEEITATYRLTTYVLKFALVSYIFNSAYKKMDIIKSDNMLEVSLEYVKEAIYIMTIFTNESHKVLELFQKNKMLNYKIDSVTVKLQKKIRNTKEKRISRSEATNSIRGLNKEKIDELIEQGLFRLEKIDRTTFITEEN
ncbi:DUF3987 domain-containing protein [Arcobacter sp.]|uniref:DUF3987 domain-containing protein n=1 Tax=Arcobacter sp. TaxID=1872629 RepID=UPI003D0A95CD